MEIWQKNIRFSENLENFMHFMYKMKKNKINKIIGASW